MQPHESLRDVTADVDVGTLDLLSRLLATTDGTLTDMLAVAFLEPIQLVVLAITIDRLSEPLDCLSLATGDSVMRRRIILKGNRSGTNYVYGEVLVAPDRLTDAFRADLVTGRLPLGQLWNAHRLETWKERPILRLRPADAHAAHFDLPRSTPLIERRYRAFSGGLPVFDVTEYFPVRFSSSAPVSE